MQLFPAVIIGGPPDSGKSTLTYHLSQALRRRGVQHYVLRAAPDGEGDWTNEAQPDLVRTLVAPAGWTAPFVEHVCHSLGQRHLPLIVDVGGRPTEWQETIFDYCTHAVLLTPNEASQTNWQALAARHNLLLLADLHSTLNDASRIEATSPHLVGVIAGLERGRPLEGVTFAALVERLAHLFDYDPDQLRRHHLTSAPVETTVDLDRLAHSLNVPFEGEKAVWHSAHLPRLLDYLPRAKPLGLYGRGPNWLYAAVALHTHPAEFYQFDVRLGWVTPPKLVTGSPSSLAVLQCLQEVHPNYVELTFSIPGAYLDYSEVEGVIIPAAPAAQKLVLSGKLPHWLIAALALAYREVPLLAIYQPQVGQVVIHSRLPEFAPGDMLS